MKKIAVFASGNGSNFQAIVENSHLGYEVDVLICNRPNAYVLERAKNLGINTYVFDHKKYKDRRIYEREIIEFLKDRDIKLIVLAGYMRLFSEVLLEKYDGRIINLHPSLLPDFPGVRAIEDAYNAKAKEMGVTIFYVDSGIDTGDIIVQEGFVYEDESLEDIEVKIHKLEHELYPKTIKAILEDM
ncbi:phosphoribosylglycinamide formyltransferase [Mycoplasmatota bacterium]|nr:phosphoribosylglycinamide formyltransferase [Mycoplasmatota bacterium]